MSTKNKLPKHAAGASSTSSCPRLLTSINLSRRFGGFMPELHFVGGEVELPIQHVVPTALQALIKAEEWIRVPGNNVKWWTDYEH